MAKRKAAKKSVTRKTKKKTTIKKAARKKTKNVVKKSTKGATKKPTVEPRPTRGARNTRGFTALGLESGASFQRGDAIIVTGGLFNGCEGNVTADGPVAGGRIPVSIKLGSSCQPKNIEPENLALGGSGPCG